MLYDWSNIWQIKVVTTFFLQSLWILGHHDTQRFMLKSSTFNASHNFFIFIALPPVAAIMLYFCEKVHTDKQKNYIALGLKDIFLAWGTKMLAIYNNNNVQILYTFYLYNRMCYLSTMCLIFIILYCLENFPLMNIKTYFFLNNKEIIAQYYKCTSGKRI